jgi:hypothetical protein
MRNDARIVVVGATNFVWFPIAFDIVEPTFAGHKKRIERHAVLIVRADFYVRRRCFFYRGDVLFFLMRKSIEKNNYVINFHRCNESF